MLAGVSDIWQYIIKGLVIVIAVALDRFRLREGARNLTPSLRFKENLRHGAGRMGGRDAARGGRMKTYAKLMCGAAVAVSMLGSASAASLDKVGISVGSLGNPFFVATIKGITDKAKAINPNVQIISVSSDYDLNKQVTQIDNFIAAGRERHHAQRCRPKGDRSGDRTCA